eukprot:TRINITY_DN20955_c0_g1_i1.p1 TRINITY_DN20955_c0_g1~~TRINITY_DN20955_c0_g1_i1.p1  ORF type:complete len:709 (-),score=90.97 TRINITY_DN20955_c0_g1_i1:441-2516(-)
MAPRLASVFRQASSLRTYEATGSLRNLYQKYVPKFRQPVSDLFAESQVRCKVSWESGRSGWQGWHSRRGLATGSPPPVISTHPVGPTPLESRRPCIVQKRGADLFHDPWFNKGTAFGITERDRLGLRGLLPPMVMTFEQQKQRFMAEFSEYAQKTQDGEEDIMLAKWRILNRLHDRNETLYYRVLIENIKNFAPIIYTPTVGTVCANYSGLFRRPRGMYFSALDQGEMISMVHNWPADQVDMIVVTDGSRILGLGDLGVQGIGITIGKLDLYVASAGIHPQRVLPVQIDVGTNNKNLLNDSLYMGLRQPRLEGEDYLAVLDEFMDAVFTRWPRLIVQFEDFQTKWAFRLLQRYRNRYRMFNDDVQGTAGVALAGLLGAVRAQGLPMEAIAKLKFVVVGAGSAGMGVVNMVRTSMAIMMGGGPTAMAQAASRFWIIDREGLVTRARGSDADASVLDYARPKEEAEESGLREGASLLDVVKYVKPDVLLGLSGKGGIFTKEVLVAMRDSPLKRPIIFPLSNPTMNSECTAEAAFKTVGSHIIFASGSPFEDVDLGNGVTGHANQGNNMYLFPGIGLGTLLSGARTISDGMLHAAATRLASLMTEEQLQQGKVFPKVDSIREIAREVAAAVLKQAVEEDLSEGYRNTDAKHFKQMSEGALSAFVEKHMWWPAYSPLIYSPTGNFKEVVKELSHG